MKIGVVFVVLIIFIGYFSPFVFSYLIHKKKENKLKLRILDFAKANNCKISSPEILLNKIIIGIDYENKMLMFIGNNDKHNNSATINLNDFARCNPMKELNDNNGISGIFGLILQPKDTKKEDFLLEFFNNENNISSNGPEVFFVDKWVKIINETINRK